MYMAGRLRTASMPPKTLMESAVYSPFGVAVAILRGLAAALFALGFDRLVVFWGRSSG